MAEQRFGASDRLALRIRLFRLVGEVSTDIDEGRGRKFAKSVESGQLEGGALHVIYKHSPTFPVQQAIYSSSSNPRISNMYAKFSAVFAVVLIACAGVEGIGECQ